MSAVLIAEFMIDGIPVPQGSKTAFVVGTRAVVTDANRGKLKPWRSTVAAAAGAAYSGEQLAGPLQMVVQFAFVRPASISAKRRPLPAVKPDLDKLLRALLDGITDSGIWRDDSQVVTLLATKVYADRPGVRVQLGEYSNQPPTETREQ